MNVLHLFLSLLPLPSVALFLFPDTPLIRPPCLNHFTGPVYTPQSPAWSSHSLLLTPQRLPLSSSRGLPGSAQMCHLCSISPTDLSHARAPGSLASLPLPSHVLLSPAVGSCSIMSTLLHGNGFHPSSAISKATSPVRPSLRCP